MSGPGSGSTMKDGRSRAEVVAPTVVRFHHPCGHSSTHDYGKGPKPKRIGAVGVAMLVRTWQRGGVVAPCPTCSKKENKNGH